MSARSGERFVGREDELGTLRGALERALAGAGELAIVSGEAGIGKTRTVAVLAEDARARGCDVLFGRCWEGEGAPLYAPWRQVLRALPADGSAGTAPVADALAALGERSTGADEPEHARFDLFDRITAGIADAARRRPLAIVLDDLHWADVGSLLLLRSVAIGARSAPLLIVGTIRDPEAGLRPQVASLLAELARQGRDVRLSGLARAEVRALVADRLAREPSETEVEAIVDATAGNPFFVLEMSSLHSGSPRGARSPGAASPAVGSTVRDLVRRRLASLPDPTRRLLDGAAVLGRDFDLVTLSTALATPEAELRDALEPAIAAGIVRARPEALRTWAFVHALVRETLHQDIAAGERSRLHQAMGEALEANDASADERLPLLAHHFFAAAECADPTKAVRYGCEAGERALELLAFEEAVWHFDRARLAAELLGDDDAKLRVLDGLGEALVASGDAERAQTVLAQAVVLARAQGPTRFAATVARAATIPAEVGKLDLATNALLEEALAGSPLAATPLRARLLARLASGLHLQPGAERRRVALATEATAMARELGDPTTLGFVLTHRLLALLGPDNLEERLATADEMLRPSAVRSRAAELAALAFRIHDLAELGERTALDLSIADFEQRSRDYGHPFFRWLVPIMRAGVAHLEGRFADAEAHANEGLSLGQEVQLKSALLNYGQLMFALRGEQGRLAEVEPLLTANVAETAVVPAWRAGLAEFYCVSGRLAEAQRELDALAADDFAGLPRDTTWLTATYLLSSICADLGDRRRAEVLAAQLGPQTGRIAAGRPLVVALGPIDHVLGRLAATQGLLDHAEQHYARALVIAERMRGLTWQAHVHRSLGALFVARGSRADLVRASEHLDRAEATARPVGMNLLLGWIEETRTALRRAESGARTAPRIAKESTAADERFVAPRESGSDPPDGGRDGAISREGDLWTISLEGRTTRVKHMVGLTHLARLVARAGEEVHVGDLMSAAYEGRRDARETATETDGRTGDDAGEVLDRKARAAYEARLRDTRDELDEATHLNDRGRVERLGAEMEALTQELARGFGLGGRARRAASTAERARVAVLRAIKYAIDKLADQDPILAEHFRRSIRTGAFCVYDPPSRDVVSWTVRGAG